MCKDWKCNNWCTYEEIEHVLIWEGLNIIKINYTIKGNKNETNWGQTNTVLLKPQKKQMMSWITTSCLYLSLFSIT